MNRIEKFIVENKLDFEGTNDSSLNSDCCIISGFALHCGISDVDDVKTIIHKARGNRKRNFYNELEKVFEFAQSNNYGTNWSTPEYKRMYKF